jgi:hypothetical protein
MIEPLEYYSCHTLFDISNADIDRSKRLDLTARNERSKNQQRNWDTIVQVISLRAQPIVLRNPRFVDADLRFYSFGQQFSGLARVWTFEFGIEAKGAFHIGENPVSGLMTDSAMVPMTVGLAETVMLDPACILVDDQLRNTYFQIVNKQ